MADPAEGHRTDHEQVTSKSAPLGQDLAVIHGGGTLNIDTDYVLTGQFQNVTSIYLSPPSLSTS